MPLRHPLDIFLMFQQNFIIDSEIYFHIIFTPQKYSSIDYFFPQPFKNVKIILAYRAYKNKVGLIWHRDSNLLIHELLEGIKKPEIITMYRNK